jgi:hypothetical protein
MAARPTANRIGAAKGEFTMPDAIDDDDAAVAALFAGNED